MNEQYRELADLCADAARGAGRVVMGFYQSGVKTWEKSVNNPVTEADLAADEYLKERLTGALPEAGWLSEETRDDPHRLDRGRVWVVDPIDGTKEFVAGIPEFAVCVALVEEGVPVACSLFNPVAEQMFTASLGGGASLDGRALKVTGRSAWIGAHLLVSRSEEARGEWEPYGEQRIEACGSIAYKMARVAAGHADATFSRGPKHEWDVCAGALLVTEAGGWSGNLDGSAYRFNQPKPLVDGVVATSPDLLENILRSVDRHGRVRQGRRD
jgi:myo-inositol-1(or 4)-monophosphatase